MDAVKKVKIKTGMQTAGAKLLYSFNRHVKGVRTKFGVSYLSDGKREHKLDISYPKDKAEGDYPVGGYPCVVYFHGGGWTAYDKCLFRSSAKELSARGAVVYNCNYRMAPKYDLADMEEDVKSAVEFAKKTAVKCGGNPNKIILAGDSSGAHLAALYVNKLCKQNDEEAKAVIGCVYFYGVYDLTTMGNVKFNNKEGYTQAVMPPTMPNLKQYLKRFSPINYVCPTLPPTLFCSGMVDPLHEGQTAVYMQVLKDLGVRVESLIFPEDDLSAEHRFITFSKNSAAKKSFAAFGEFIKTLENGVRV